MLEIHHSGREPLTCTWWEGERTCAMGFQGREPPPVLLELFPFVTAILFWEMRGVGIVERLLWWYKREKERESLFRLRHTPSIQSLLERLFLTQATAMKTCIMGMGGSPICLIEERERECVCVWQHLPVSVCVCTTTCVYVLCVWVGGTGWHSYLYLYVWKTVCGHTCACLEAGEGAGGHTYLYLFMCKQLFVCVCMSCVCGHTWVFVHTCVCL